MPQAPQDLVIVILTSEVDKKSTYDFRKVATAQFQTIKHMIDCTKVLDFVNYLQGNDNIQLEDANDDELDDDD